MIPPRLRRLFADPAALADAALWRLRRAVREGPGRAAEAVRERLFPLRVRHVAGPKRVEAGPTDLVVVCLVRDGAVYLDGFLDHYRSLGARHVVFLDNGSTDGTVERAAAEPDVTVLQTHAPYKDYKVITKRYLIRRFGRGCWALCVDIDELFDYPRRPDVPLGDFLGYLNGRGFTAVVAYLLDLYPSGPLAEAGDWQTEHRFYSLEALRRLPYAPKVSPPNHVSNAEIEWYNGGVREARFGVRPNLTKHPLQFPSGGVRHESSHHASGARVADVTGVLLHYKYASGFLDYAERLVAEKSFYDGSAEYVGYLDAFQEDPAFRLDAPGSQEYGGPDRLVDEGFLVTSEAYRAFADARAVQPAAP